MITSRYIVTGKQHGTTQLWLRSQGGDNLYMATGFVDAATRFYERRQAEATAERENHWYTNGAKVWRGVTWRVEQITIDVLTAQGAD